MATKRIPIRDQQDLPSAFALRYKEVTISVLEVVPPVDELPYCTAVKPNGNICDYHARYLRNGKPSCGPHLASKYTLFLEDD